MYTITLFASRFNIRLVDGPMERSLRESEFSELSMPTKLGIGLSLIVFPFLQEKNTMHAIFEQREGRGVLPLCCVIHGRSD